MPEDILTTEQPKRFDVGRFLNLARRRYVYFLLPFFLGWLIVFAASWIMPVRYKSTTTILVQEPSVPTTYITPNVNANLQDRLASLTEQILSRTRLLLIANRLHLYHNSKTPLTPDAIVGEMRKDIKVSVVRDPESGAISGFTVAYSAPSPHLAQQVTSQLTNLFIQENQQSLQNESESTTKFLQQQLADARESLSKQEAKVKQFQSAHQGTLPTQQASNLQILSGLQSQLQNAEDSLNSARQQKVYLQSLIQQYDALGSRGSAGGATPTDLASINTELSNMRSQLASLKSQYTDRYPAVQALQSKIDAAVKERNRLLAAIKASPHATGKQQEKSSKSSTANVPATGAAVLQLKSQLDATNAEISTRQNDIAQLKQRIDAYQARLNSAPAVEAQLSSLTRGYEQSQANYNELLKKENNSAMATSMERLQQGERFSVLDPPSLPERPDSPKRTKLSLLGIGVGLALGLIVAGGMEFLDDRLYSDKEIEDLLPVAVIGEIPVAATETEQRRAKRRVVLGWALLVLVVLVIGAGSLFNYVDASSSSIHLGHLLSKHHV